MLIFIVICISNIITNQLYQIPLYHFDIWINNYNIYNDCIVNIINIIIINWDLKFKFKIFKFKF